MKVKKRHHKTWRQRARNLAANILRHYERQNPLTKMPSAANVSRKFLSSSQRTKCCSRWKKRFSERVAEIQRYYLSEHEKEAKAGDKRRREKHAKILKRMNQDTCRLEREELTRRGVVR